VSVRNAIGRTGIRRFPAADLVDNLTAAQEITRLISRSRTRCRI